MDNIQIYKMLKRLLFIRIKRIFKKRKKRRKKEKKRKKKGADFGGKPLFQTTRQHLNNS